MIEWSKKPEIVEVLVPIDDPNEAIVIDALNFEETLVLRHRRVREGSGKVEKKKLKPEFRKKRLNATLSWAPTGE